MTEHYMDVAWPEGMPDDGQTITKPNPVTIEVLEKMAKDTAMRFSWTFTPNSNGRYVDIRYVNYKKYNGKIRISLDGPTFLRAEMDEPVMAKWKVADG